MIPPEETLRKMVGEAINFDAPLVTIAEKMHVLELLASGALDTASITATDAV